MLNIKIRIVTKKAAKGGKPTRKKSDRFYAATSGPVPVHILARYATPYDKQGKRK